ncbi:YkgJ family cysteine cluster protein [bacterium]|nr:YkgJ family cysteine cluster protein [bacterium]
MVLYAEIDRQTAAFAEGTGLACPPGCGACCLSPEVEATVLEMLPLAQWLVHEGRGEEVLADLVRWGIRQCIFYGFQSEDGTLGRCGVYAVRPLLCRLFGFAAVRDRTGRAQLAACWRHQETVPEAVDRARQAIGLGEPVPLFNEWAMRLSQLDPHYGVERLPINEALGRAIGYYGLWQQMQS